MKKFIFLVLLCLSCQLLYAQEVVDEYYAKGLAAFMQSRDDEAVKYLYHAINRGSEHACGLLSFMYYVGAIDGRCNESEASKWAKKVTKVVEPYSSFVKGILETYKGNFEEAIKHLEIVPRYIEITEGTLALGVCYYQIGHRDKAKEYALKIYDKYKDKDIKNGFYYMACALLSKIEYDNDKSASQVLLYAGETKDTDCPLGQYMMGRYQIENNMYPSVGKKRVANAARYEYRTNIFEPNRFILLESFEEEIKAYHKKIK